MNDTVELLNPAAAVERPLRQERQTPPLPSEPKSLNELGREIRAAHADVLSYLSKSAWAAIRAGKDLKSAKARVRNDYGHGYWELWVERECQFGMRTAQIYMYLAAHEAQLCQLLNIKANENSFLTQAQALKLLSVGKKKKKPRRPKKLEK